MNWLHFQMKGMAGNMRVDYTTSDSHPNKLPSMKLEHFHRYLQDIAPIIPNREGLLEELTSFSRIFLDMETKQWQVITPILSTNEQLLDLSTKTSWIEENEKRRQDAVNQTVEMEKESTFDISKNITPKNSTAKYAKLKKSIKNFIDSNLKRTK